MSGTIQDDIEELRKIKEKAALKEAETELSQLDAERLQRQMQSDGHLRWIALSNTLQSLVNEYQRYERDLGVRVTFRAEQQHSNTTGCYVVEIVNESESVGIDIRFKLDYNYVLKYEIQSKKGPMGKGLKQAETFTKGETEDLKTILKGSAAAVIAA